MKKIFCLFLSLLMFLPICAAKAEEPADDKIDAYALAAESVPAGQNDGSVRENTYDYPLYGDPNYIQDSTFFGIWNTAGQSWSTQPLLDYDRWSGLAPVEEAVKSGDYEVAEFELLEYYRGLKDERSKSRITATSEGIRRQAYLRGKNVFYSNGANIIAVFSVENEWNEIKIDVTSALNSFKGATPRKSLGIFSVDRSSVAEFMTQEGGYTAKIVANVNDKPIEFPAIRDTYAACGTLQNTSFGGEPHMLASENSANPYVYDENNKRSFITFNIANLKAGDKITGATLTLKGRNLSGTGAKELVLYNTTLDLEENAHNWVQGSVSLGYFTMNDQDAWDYKKTPATITENDARPAYRDSTYHNGSTLSNIANAYEATRNEEFAYTYLRHIMAQYHYDGDAVNAFNSPHQLSRAVYLNTVSACVYRVLDSETMTPEIFTALLKLFYSMSKRVVEGPDGYGDRTNNWATYYTAGVYAVLSRFKELSTYDEWLELTRQENHRMSDILVRDDGTSIEKSVVYNNVLFSTLNRPYDLSRNTGNTDYPTSEEDRKSLERLVKSYCYTMAPGFNSFYDGDDNATYNDPAVCIQNVKQFYNDVLSDVPELEFFATGGKSGNPPEFTSIGFPNGLYTILRSGWTNNATGMKIDVNATGSHNHFDQTSVSMWAYGKFLITDQGTSPPDESPNQELIKMRNSDNHSMVVMNGKSLPDPKKVKNKGMWLGHDFNSLFDFTSYAISHCPDAETQQRSVFFDKHRKIYIVSDYLKPKNASAINSYAQYWNMLPDANMTLDPASGVARSNFPDINVSVTPVAPEELSEAAIEDVYFSYGGTNLTPAKKAAYHKEAVGDVTFDTVIIPENLDEKFSVEPLAVSTGLPQGAADAFYFDLFDDKTGSQNRMYYMHLNDTAQKTNNPNYSVAIGKYKTDATTMYVTEDADGRLESAYLMDATYLEDSTLTDKYVFQSKQKIPALSFRKNGMVLEMSSGILDTSNEQDMALVDQMTIYGYGKLKSAVLNGVSKEVKKSAGGYLYFGESPVIDGTPSGDENDTSSGNGSGGQDTHAAGSRGGNSVSGGVSTAPPADNTVDKPGEAEGIAAELANHWAKKEISELYEAGIIKGDGPSLRLSDCITRAELVSLVVRTLGLTGEDATPSFADIPFDAWYAEAVAAAEANDLISGSGGMFRPDDFITREEMCKILLLAYRQKTGKQSGEKTDKSFDDDEKISDWAKEYVYGAAAVGLIKGVDGNQFAPKSCTLREQAFVVLWRLMNNG